MSRTFSSLSNPNYRTYFIGILASNTGLWMTRTAQSWLVLMQLTQGNAQALGWLTSVMFLPTLLLTPVAGALADRLPKRTIVMRAQYVLLFDILVLATLVLTGHIQLWHVFLLAFMDGCAAAFDGPARQAYVSEIVPLSGLSNAIGLNSASFNAARLIGPGLAGFLIALIGTGPVFIANSLTYVVLLVCLGRLNSSRVTPVTGAPRSRGGLMEGFRYVKGRPDLILLFLVALMMGTFAFNYAITNALMATKVFGVGAGGYGLLGSVMGSGSLVAALLAARRPRPRVRIIMVSLGAFVMFSLASAVAPTFEVFAVLMVPIGFTAVTIMVTANSLVQMSVAAAVRGRIMALWGATMLGFTPIVSPLIGWIGDAFGARATVMVGVVALGLTFVATSVYLVVNEEVHVRLSRGKPWVNLSKRDTDGLPAVQI